MAGTAVVVLSETLRRDEGFDIPFAPSGNGEKFSAPLRISPRCLHTDRRISLMLHPVFACQSPQNPPVLLSLKSACVATDTAPFQRQREQKV